MKKILFAALMLVSVNAFAGIWELVHSEFVQNTWVCTYRLQGSNYIVTIFSDSYCQSFIFQ